MDIGVLFRLFRDCNSCLFAAGDSLPYNVVGAFVVIDIVLVITSE